MTAALKEVTGNAPTSGHFVYDLLDESGAVIYVGVSSNLRKRLATHAREKEGWVSARWVEHPTRKIADSAEVARIAELQPPLNNAGQQRAVAEFVARIRRERAAAGKPDKIEAENVYRLIDGILADAERQQVDE